jgi:hypothetical protein
VAATRTDYQRESDLPLINAWYLQGKTQFWIAEELAKLRPYEVSRQTISNDLKAIRKRWLNNTNIPRDQHAIKELARIDLLEETYWAAYLRSLEKAEITTKRVKDSGQAKSYDASTRVEERDGNPAYLAGVERCIKLRMDLLGLNAPVKSEDTIRIIDEAAVNADLRRRVQAGELSYEELLYATDNDTSLANALFAGAAHRVSTDKDET